MGDVGVEAPSSGTAVSDAGQDVSDDQGAHSAERRHRRRRVLTVAAVLAMLVAGGGWWLTTPPSPFTGSYGSRPRDPMVGRTLWTPLVISVDPAVGPVRIADLDPVVSKEGAVDVEYLVCDLDPAWLQRRGTGTFDIGGSPDAMVRRACRDTHSAIGTTFPDGTGPQNLLVGITPTRADTTVRLPRHRVSFWSGIRHGRSTIEVTVVLRDVRPAGGRVSRP